MSGKSPVVIDLQNDITVMKATNLPSIATAKANGMIFIEKYTDSEGEQTVVYGLSRKAWKEK